MAEEKLRRCGGIEYILYRKNIKNMYIRISRDRKVKVSANRYVSLERIEYFILMNENKITAQLERLSRVVPPDADKDKCLRLFEEISMKYYPLFREHVGDTPPQIKVKDLTATWGICHIKDNYISLSSRLYAKSREAVEYVVLHEYAHFVHRGHQKDFYALIESIMPDYKKRKALLNTKI